MIAITTLRQAIASPVFPNCLAAVSRASLNAISRGYSAGTPSVVEVKDDADFERIIKKDNRQGLTVVDFTAAWCGPCKFIAPYYEKLSTEHPTVTFTKLDIDKPEVSGTVRDYEISAVPTFLLFKEGKRVGVLKGANLEDLKKLVATHK